MPDEVRRFAGIRAGKKIVKPILLRFNGMA